MPCDCPRIPIVEHQHICAKRLGQSRLQSSLSRLGASVATRASPAPHPFTLTFAVGCFSRLFTQGKTKLASSRHQYRLPESPLSCRTDFRILKREAFILWVPRRCTAFGMNVVNASPGPLEGLFCRLSSTCCSVLRVLICQRPAHPKLVRIIHSIATSAMRRSSQVTPSVDAPQVNEKQEAWLEYSYHWWRVYGSFIRAWGLLFRQYSANAVAW